MILALGSEETAGLCVPFHSGEYFSDIHTQEEKVEANRWGAEKIFGM